MFFSIAIPCYEMGGKGSEFLNFSLCKIESQSFKDFEVIVSDHSYDDSIKKVCDDWSDRIDIKYFRNTEGVGSSSLNINNAIRNSNGEWIKILFQDDFLYSENSLLDIKDSLNDKTFWVATACEHTNDGESFYRPFLPKWNDDIKYGINTISSPSVITIRKDLGILFDPEYIWLMDTDWYYRIWISYGEPQYIKKINVVNRTWSDSVSNTISDFLKRSELKKIKEKYV